MDRHFHRKVYKVRPSQSKGGLEVTLPSSLRDDGILKVGDFVEVLFDTFIVIAPPGQSLNPQKLANAIELAREDKEVATSEAKTKERSGYQLSSS